MKHLLNVQVFKRTILGFFYFTVALLGLHISSSLGNLTYANNDLLNQAFDESKRYDTVANPGNDKNAVGAQVFNPTTDVSLGNIGGADGRSDVANTKEPYLVRLTKLILRITIALSVSIIIYAGISYILAFGDAGKQKKAMNIVTYALLGILIGLSSLAIVELALSITKSSLEF